MNFGVTLVLPVRGCRLPELVLSVYSPVGFSETMYFRELASTLVPGNLVRAKKAAIPQASALVTFDPHRFMAFRCPAPLWQSRQSIELSPRNVVATRTASPSYMSCDGPIVTFPSRVKLTAPSI